VSEVKNNAFRPNWLHQLWVKAGKAHCEDMFSALPLRADIAQRSRHVRCQQRTMLDNQPDMAEATTRAAAKLSPSP
jgi:hypothetical protein